MLISFGKILLFLHVTNGAVLQVEVLYGDEPLKDYYTLMDIAYFYEWRRVSDGYPISEAASGSRLLTLPIAVIECLKLIMKGKIPELAVFRSFVFTISVCRVGLLLQVDLTRN